MIIYQSSFAAHSDSMKCVLVIVCLVVTGVSFVFFAKIRLALERFFVKAPVVTFFYTNPLDFISFSFAPTQQQ